jgi:hypothetical protein
MEAALEDISGCKAAIPKAVSEGNGEALRQAAHKLKGVMGYFGDNPAVSLALDLEMMGKENDLSRAGETAGVLEKEMEQCTLAMKKYLQGDISSGKEPAD